MQILNHPKPAIIHKDGEVSYTDLLKNISAIAKILKNEPFKAVILSENRPEWIFAFYAIIKQNGISVPVDFLSSEDEILYILNDCEPDYIFCSNQTIKKAQQVSDKASKKPALINFDELKINYQNENAEEIKPDNYYDTSFIIYTSGTTGSPKGVMLTHDNIQSNIESVHDDAKIFIESDRVMILLPLHHSFPLTGTIIAPLHVGATVVIAPSMNPDDIRNTLKDGKITLLIGVPRLYQQLMKGIKQKIDARFIARVFFQVASLLNSRKFSKKIFSEIHNAFGGSMRYLVSGGAALDIKSAKFFKTLGFEMLEGYGMTETAPMISCNRPGQIRLGSAGIIVINMEVKIENGEICARGRNVMKGYYNKPEETDKIIKDGWLHTGDSGYIDKNNFLFVTGRIKETIVLENGKNINPEEIEEKLSRSHFIKECGIFLENGILKALVVPDLTEIEQNGIHNIHEFFKWDIIDSYNKSVSPYKKILSFSLTENELPRTRLGKLQRFKLKDISTSKQTEENNNSNQPESEEYSLIREYIEKTKQISVKPQNHLELDLGMDSLDKVALISFIKTRFGIKIEDEDASKLTTPESLAKFAINSNSEITEEISDWKTILNTDSMKAIPQSRWPHIALRNFFKIFINIICRIETNAPKTDITSPVIIAPNHQSNIDWILLASVLSPEILRKTYIFAKAKHFNTPFRKFLAKRSNIILVDINSNLKDTIQKMGEVLRNKCNVVIFPEGTRTQNGELGEYKKTFAILSKELNIPVIPIAIKGAYKAYPAGAKFIRPFTKITVNFIEPQNAGNHSYEEFTENIRSLMKTHLL
ncbi:MAG TPA: AMP-binding protein [Spirochaetota bacterium]|jgi:long-chain acyl-CoA synthetase|nr:AMP-binding protein [Spirochaetota bacterium]HQO22341.1 AMP-binding protein [Spirochaetota bacterium]HQQ23514.1 AMP-binding protein [Spirochaetota bacterium]